MSYLCYMCLVAYSGPTHIMLCFCFVCLRLVAVFSGLTIFIALSVFSNVYLNFYDRSASLLLKYNLCCLGCPTDEWWRLQCSLRQPEQLQS